MGQEIRSRREQAAENQEVRVARNGRGAGAGKYLNLFSVRESGVQWFSECGPPGQQLPPPWELVRDTHSLAPVLAIE